MDDNVIQFPAPANDAPQEAADMVEAILQAREKQYGSYPAKAQIIQDLKATLHGAPRWYTSLSDVQRESLDMIVHKIGRIVAGNPNHIDSWDDIAGYARLVSRSISNGE